MAHNRSIDKKQEILAKIDVQAYFDEHLPGTHWNGKDGKARCPFHLDKEPSLHINSTNGLWKCFGCNTSGDLFAFYMDLYKVDFPQALKEIGKFAGISSNGRRGMGGNNTPPKNSASLHHQAQPTKNTEKSTNAASDAPCSNAFTGITLAQYSQAKKIPVGFLKSLGVTDIVYQQAPALRIAYYGADGNEISVRIRTELRKSDDGQDNRFKWKKGSKVFLYGVNRVSNENYRILVEGESDCHTLWYSGFPAVGIPGATNWNEDRDAAHFDGIDIIYFIKEPDKGGESLKDLLSKSRIKARVKVVSLNGYKDASDMYVHDPENFKANFSRELEKATPWLDIEAVENEAERKELWNICSALALKAEILDEFIKDLTSLGVAGEEKAAKTVFLALVSRDQERPVSIVLKGPSASGKSFVVQETIKFFPESAYLTLTDMSARMLVFTDESLSNRFIVLYEATGLSSGKGNSAEGDDATKSYLIRSILSEGHIRYGVTEKTKDGFRARIIEKPGPTGMIITTTTVNMHPENETRYLSFTVTDTQAQTRNIFRAIVKAQEKKNESGVNFERWHALHQWLDLSGHTVTIPYANNLAELIPPVAVRLRRDFTLILNLIRSHAILHQATRQKDDEGRVVANLTDYAVVRDLVSSVISDGVGSTVSASVRDVVEEVKKIVAEGDAHASVHRLAQNLKLDRSSITRRVKVALENGYLVNNEEKRGKAFKLVIGDAMPDEVEVLPLPDKLDRCSDAAISEGINTPLPPCEDDFIHEDDIPEVEAELC